MDKMNGFLKSGEFLKENNLRKPSLYRAIGNNYIDPVTKLISSMRYEIKTKQTVNSKTWKVYFYPSPLIEGKDYIFDDGGKIWVKRNLDISIIKKRKSDKCLEMKGGKPVYDVYTKRVLEILTSKMDALQIKIIQKQNNKDILSYIKTIEKFLSVNSYFFPYRFILDCKNIFIELKKTIKFNQTSANDYTDNFIDAYDKAFEKIFLRKPLKVQSTIKDRLEDIFETAS